jgi:hypothetical protein
MKRLLFSLHIRYELIVRSTVQKILFALLPLALFGCGNHHEAHQGSPVFKGTVVRVQYRLTEGTTVLIDSDGKLTKLEGFPSVPCDSVEIYQHGKHAYEVYQAPQS